MRGKTRKVVRSKYVFQKVGRGVDVYVQERRQRRLVRGTLRSKRVAEDYALERDMHLSSVRFAQEPG